MRSIMDWVVVKMCWKWVSISMNIEERCVVMTMWLVVIVMCLVGIEMGSFMHR